MGQTIVVGSCNGLIHGVDKATGSARWKYEARADGGRPEFHSAPLAVGDLVIMGSDDRRPDGVGYVYAIEAASGSIRWKTRIGRGSMTDLVRLADRLYAVTLDNELIALHLVTGKLDWSFRGGRPLATDFPNVLATPAVTTDRVYFGGADGMVSALAADSGALVWKSEIGSRIVTPLLLLSNALYFGTLDGRLLRVGADHGTATAELKLGQVPFGPLVPTGQSILAFSVEGETAVLNAFDISLAAPRWSRRAERGWSSARPYLWQGAALVGDEAGELSALAVEDGTPIWTRRLEGVIRGIGFDHDRLLVGTLAGAVFAIRAPVAERR